MKKIVKPIIALALVVFMLLSVLSGCLIITDEPSGSGNNSGKSNTNTSSTTAAKESYKVGEATVTVWTNSINTKWVRVIVPIINDGKADLYLSSSSIDLETSDGKLIQTLKYVSVYPEVIKPGETGYYFQETTYDGNETKNIKAILHPDVDKAKVECVRLKTSDLQLKDDKYTGLKVIGRVENDTDDEQSLVYVAAILYDKNKNVIGIKYTIISDDIGVGEKIGFEAISLTSDIKSSNVASFEVIAYPNQFQF